MPAQTRNLRWFHADDGLLPTDTRQPWTRTGTGGLVVLDDALRITSVSAAHYFWSPLGPQDVRSTGPRATDRVTLQWRVRGEVAVPGAWASQTSPIVAGIDDGARAIGVSIGTRLQWVDPYLGTALGVIAEGFPWTRDQTFRLTKDRGARFLLEVDGRTVASIPFGACPTRPGSVAEPPQFLWGHLDSSGTATTFWRFVEGGLNEALVPQWIGDRLRDTAPRLIQRAWNARSRALFRSVASLWQGVIEAMEEVQTLPLAARDTIAELTVDGERDPATVGWTMLDGPGVGYALVRERVRMGTPGGPVRMQAGFAAVDDLVRPDVEARIRARFTLRAHDLTGDASGRVGPFLEVENTHRRIRADLLRGTGAHAARFGWVLTERTGGDAADPVTQRGQWHWFVDPYQTHEVEIQVLGRNVVVLLVDEQVVDVAHYGDWTDSQGLASSVAATAGVWGSVDFNAVADLEDVVASLRYTDLSRRPWFAQRIAERAVFAGGCERNDLLDTLLRNRLGLWRGRGTLKGLTLEVQRLSCSRRSTIETRSKPAGWYLDVTRPPGDVVYLDAVSVLTTLEIELHFRSTTFTLARFATLVAQYLAPVSLVELGTEVHAKALLTGTTLTGGGQTTVPVDDSGIFTVGDDVELRDVTTNAREQATVLAVTDTTTVVISELTGTFALNDVLRKRLV